MRQKCINVYPFKELSDSAKEKAIEKFYDINVNFDWWDSTYVDAKETAGLIITGFDIDRGSYCKGEFDGPATECAELILKNHGETCETYKTAKSFLNALNELTSQYENIEDCPEEDIEELEDEFLRSLLEDYRIILSNEYDYLTGKEAIIETIEANDYEFTEDGKLA